MVNNSIIDHLPMFSSDIDELKLISFNVHILKILLSDKTTRRNIIWGTNDYISYGESYGKLFPITIEQITSWDSDIIRPRILKSKTDQNLRKKDKAEVFTPAWICNNQINLIDDAWFGMQGLFNTCINYNWTTNKNKIPFQIEKPYRWQDYIDLKRLEITCGEAPYITSRYDMQTGIFIAVTDRIGMLDRKLRIVSENTSSMEDWIKWATRSVESIYGFEFQGDSLLIARENILLTFVEHMNEKFHCIPDAKLLKEIANIIAWNIWQMDALTCSVPYHEITEQYKQTDLSEYQQENILCKIHDWRSKKTMNYIEMFKEGN